MSNELASVNCSDLHPNFHSKVYITRPCHYNREWGNVDFSQCTMKPNSTVIIMIEVKGILIANNTALIMNDVSKYHTFISYSVSFAVIYVIRA